MQSKIIQLLTLIIVATSAVAAATHTFRTAVPCCNPYKSFSVQVKKDVTAASFKITQAPANDVIFSDIVHADKAFN